MSLGGDAQNDIYCNEGEKLMALNIAEGIVERISQKQVNTQYGEKTSYSVKLDDGEWYSMGFQRPEYGEGSKLQFTYKLNGKYRNADKDNVEVLEKVDAAVATASTPATGGTTSGGGREDYWQSKDARDIERDKRDIERDKRLDLVGARNSAIAVVTKAVELGVLQLGAANAKKEVKFEILLDTIDKVAERYCQIEGNKFGGSENKPEEVSEED